jgi:hypothetical protein
MMSPRSTISTHLEATDCDHAPLVGLSGKCFSFLSFPFFQILNGVFNHFFPLFCVLDDCLKGQTRSNHGWRGIQTRYQHSLPPSPLPHPAQLHEHMRPRISTPYPAACCCKMPNKPSIPTAGLHRSPAIAERHPTSKSTALESVPAGTRLQEASRSEALQRRYVAQGETVCDRAG